MARPRKKKQASSEATVETPVERHENASVAVAEKPIASGTSAVEPPFEPTGSYTPAAGDTPQARTELRGRFRSWVSDTSRGYSRLSDNEQRKIVLTFNDKPPSDVLTAVKDAGFQYKPDHGGVKNAWVRYDDHQGRIQAEAIDSLVRSLIPGGKDMEL